MDQEIWSDSSTCKRCGREIAGELSLERGYGPVCFKKVQEANEQHETENDGGGVQESFEV